MDSYAFVHSIFPRGANKCRKRRSSSTYLFAVRILSYYKSLIIFLEFNINFSGKYFPCKMCANHFMNMIKEFPLEYNDREDTMKWVCNMHNSVNERLGKNTFPCNRIKEIWGQKSCGCSVKS